MNLHFPKLCSSASSNMQQPANIAINDCKEYYPSDLPHFPSPPPLSLFLTLFFFLISLEGASLVLIFSIELHLISSSAVLPLQWSKQDARMHSCCGREQQVLITIQRCRILCCIHPVCPVPSIAHELLSGTGTPLGAIDTMLSVAIS